MKRRLIILGTILLLLIGGGFLADRMLKSRNHPGLRTFLHQWWVNYPASFAVEPLELSIHVEQRDLDAIQAVVEAARERGVIMPEGNEYVPAVLEYEGYSFRTKLRIKGKMDDHVKGKKWSFRVIAKKDNGFFGMQRFSLQHPGTRNYLCDWFYHRLMKGEGAIALRYGFIQLKFNDEDLGVYAYEEHFGPEVLANNGRLKGPLFRFDPGLFWVHRLNMMQQIRYNEPFGTYQAAALDPFGGGDLEKDSTQLQLFEEAIGRMDAFRRGQLNASEVFDAHGLGIRHAILDLVGGHHSMDWSDVKFYFDPVLKRIEPVAYESFSAFPIRTLAGSDRYIGKQESHMDLHEAYFNDPVVFRAYVHALEQVSATTYLDSAFAVLAPALDSASALIYREFPYKELDRSIYYANQKTIRRLLDVPKGFHAYANGGTDTLHFTIVPLEGLPMEVYGLVGKSGAVYPPLAEAIVPIRRPSGIGVPMDLFFAVNASAKADLGKGLTLRYGVLGASTMKELEAFPYGYMDGLTVPGIAFTGTMTLPSFMVADGPEMIRILPGNHVLDKDVFIPPGHKVNATTPLRIDLRNGARLISRSPMEWKGTDDLPIQLGSSDASGGGIVLLETKGMSTLEHVRLSGSGGTTETGPAFLAQEANVTFRECTLGEVLGRDVVVAVRSRITFIGGSITGGQDQLTLAYCQTDLNGTEFNGASDDAISVKGGAFNAERAMVYGAKGNGIKVDEFGHLILKSGSIQSKKDALVASEGANITVQGGSLSSTTGAALKVDKRHQRHGPTRVRMDGCDLDKVAEEPSIGAGNDVRIDGKEYTLGQTQER